MKTSPTETSATTRFKINLSGTNLYVGNACGGYTAKAAMKSLAREIEPKIYEYGFLKR